MSSDNQLLDKIQKQMLPLQTARSGYIILNLDSLIAFDWDSVYFFKDDSGFNTDVAISKTIGFEWHGRSIPNMNERILFVHKRKVVRYVDFSNEVLLREVPHPTWAYICTSGKQHGFARNQAQFVVFRHCSKNGLNYPLLAAECVKYKGFQEMLAEGCTDLAERLVRIQELEYEKYLDSLDAH